jgi:hypothetical protein
MSTRWRTERTSIVRIVPKRHPSLITVTDNQHNTAPPSYSQSIIIVDVTFSCLVQQQSITVVEEFSKIVQEAAASAASAI